MASLNPGAANPSPPSPNQDPLETYLLESIFDLVHHADNLFSRYRATGVKYHSMPWTARASERLQDDAISMLDEVYSLTTDMRLADCVAGTFSDLIYCIAEANRAIQGNKKDIVAADSFIFDAFNLAEKLEKRMYATEAAVADLVAIRNSLTEQGLVPTPDPWADAALLCFEEWAEALIEWTKEMTEMASEILLDPAGGGLEGIIGFGG
ncbi:hypothetical protein Q7P35_007309 [Cladosporium inversicolor]